MTSAGNRLRSVRVVVAGLVLTLAGGLAVATTAPAYAADRTQTDAAGDPVRTTFDFRSDEEPTTETAVNVARVDLTSTRFDYRRQVLVVRGTARSARKGVIAQLQIKAAGRTYFFSGLTRRQVFGFSFDGNDGGEVSCPGARYTINKERSTYQLRIPAGCFGSPDSARVGFGLDLERSSRRMQTSTFDDANRTGAKGDGFGLGSKLGRALKRG